MSALLKAVFSTALSGVLLASLAVGAQEPTAVTETQEEEGEAIRLDDEITVTAGHSSRKIEDVPLRVEVVDREEIVEKVLMTPGSVAMLLAETTGLRLQATAPSTGAANVRIQGLRGCYSLLPGARAWRTTPTAAWLTATSSLGCWERNASAGSARSSTSRTSAMCDRPGTTRW